MHHLSYNIILINWVVSITQLNFFCDYFLTDDKIHSERYSYCTISRKTMGVYSIHIHSGTCFQRVEEFRTNEMLLWLDERALIKGSTDHSCCPGRSKPASYQGWGFVLVLFMGLLRKHFFVSELAIELWLSDLRIGFKTESIYLEERQHIKNAWLCKICQREATIGTHVPSTSLVLKIKLTVQEISNELMQLLKMLF